MDKETIVNYIKQHKGAEIATLQKKFGITYREAKSLIDELVKEACLVYQEGIHYAWIKEDDTTLESPWKVEDKTLTFSPKTVIPKGRVEQLEITDLERARAKRIDEIRYDALFYCVCKGTASSSMLQHAFSIDFVQAWKLLEWMQDNGYIASQAENGRFRVCITEARCHEIMEQHKQPLPEERKGLRQVLACIMRNIDEISEHTATMLLSVLEPREPDGVNEEPSHALWIRESIFYTTVVTLLFDLIRSDFTMGREAAIRKAEALLQSTKDAGDALLVQVYERIVYACKVTSDWKYDQMRDCLKTA